MDHRIPGGTLVSWDVLSLWRPRIHSTAGVYRVDCVVDDGAHTRRCSLVLKVLRRAAPDAMPAEAALYESEVLRHLPPVMRAPAWFGNVDLGRDFLGVWLGFERDEADGVWTPDRFGLAARHLGALAATRQSGLLAFAASRPQRRFWANRDQMTATVDALRSALANARTGAPETRRALVEMWAGREDVFERADRLPMMICHGDAQRRNLFAAGDATIAFDWANVGMAPVGMDIATLVYYAVAYFDVDPEEYDELERRAVQGYIHGLGDGGRPLDPEVVWTGYRAQVAFGIGLLEVGNSLRWIDDPRMADGIERLLARPLDGILQRRDALAGHLLRIGATLA